jgi:hypothetical protein
MQLAREVEVGAPLQAGDPRLWQPLHHAAFHDAPEVFENYFLKKIGEGLGLTFRPRVQVCQLLLDQGIWDACVCDGMKRPVSEIDSLPLYPQVPTRLPKLQRRPTEPAAIHVVWQQEKIRKRAP